MTELNIKLPLDRDAIKKCIPHREPFLLVDVVEEVTHLGHIKAYRIVDPNDPIFKGHFPGNPVYPGVLICEGLAQSSAILGHLSSPGGCTECMLTELTDTRFRKPVFPGAKLEYHVKYKKSRIPFHWFEAVAIVDGQQVATASFSALMR